MAGGRKANSRESGTCEVISPQRVTNSERSASPSLGKCQPTTAVMISTGFGVLGETARVWHLEDTQ